MRRPMNSIQIGTAHDFTRGFALRADRVPCRYDGRSKLADHYQGNPEWQNRDHYGTSTTETSLHGIWLTLYCPAYGGGRRICPGMHLAERTLWQSMAKLLWAFEITPASDPVTGQPKPIHTAAFAAQGEPLGFMGGANRIAIPFEASIKPRSLEIVETIKREDAEVSALLSQFN